MEDAVSLEAELSAVEFDVTTETPAAYLPYKPTLALAANLPLHPSPVVEAATLSFIPLPEVNVKLDKSLLNGCLSALQVEALLLACKTHNYVKNNVRAGMLIGDGAGVGKGREIAGIIQQNYFEGRTKSLWITKSHNLYNDASRDFEKLQTDSVVVLERFSRIYKPEKKIVNKSPCCLFFTYSWIRKNATSKIEKLVTWLGKSFDGVIALDECHCIKNEDSLAALAVKKLDAEFPNARFVYASATVAESASHIGYMSRLFLWGPGTSYPEGFKQLKDVVEKVGFLGAESIALELKHRGSYVARRLDFSNSKFSVNTVELTDSQIKLYNASTEIWKDVKAALQFKEAKKSKSEILMYYWREHLSFFKLLCLCFKIQHLVSVVRSYVADDKAVIIGLQSTGACSMRSTKKQRNKIPSALSRKLRRVIHYFMSISAMKSSVSKKLNGKVHTANFPPNPLDELVNKLNHKCVTELTGRKEGYIKQGNQYILRRIKNSRTERLKDFMNGVTNIAIVSEACSTGISLHADRDAKNQRKRIHITIELPWSAEQMIQQCGRSLRSNQISSPDYELIVVNCGGEHRFGYGISQRMAALGALTQGDRNVGASGMRLLNLNSHYAEEAVVLTLKTITCQIDRIVYRKNIMDFFKAASKHLIASGLVNMRKGIPIVVDGISVTKFLNRLLSIPLPFQNQLYDYFTEIYTCSINHRKTMGCFEEGILDIGKGETYLEGTESYPCLDSTTLIIYRIMVDNGVPYKTAEEIKRSTIGANFFVSKMDKIPEVYLAVPEVNSINYSYIFPFGMSSKKTNSSALSATYKQVNVNSAKVIWNSHFFSRLCYHKKHGRKCLNADYCPVGNRFARKYILTGMMWSNLITVMKCITDARISATQPVRCQLGKRRIVGIAIPEEKLELLKQQLSNM